MDLGDDARRGVGGRARRVLRRALRWSLASVYQLTVRVAVSATTLLLFVYFTVNSPSVVVRVGDLLSDVLPGSVALSGLRWGPSPGTLVVSGLRLRDPDGADVLGVGRVALELAWLSLLGDLVDGDRHLTVRVTKLELDGLDLRLEESPDGRLRLLRALLEDKPEPEPDPPGRALTLAIDGVRLRDARLRMDLAGTQVDVDSLRADAQVNVEVTPTATALGWSVQRLKAAGAAVRLDTLEAAGLAQLPAGAVAIESAFGDAEAARLRGLRVEAHSTRIERADVMVRWAPELSVQVRRGVLATHSPREPFLAAMLGDAFDADVRYEGEVDVDAAGRTVARGAVEGEGRVAGFDLGRLRGDVVVETPTAAGDVVDVEVKALAVDAFGGALTSDHWRYRLAADGLQTTGGILHLRGVSTAEALTQPAIGMALAAALPIAATLDGDCQVDVRLRTGAASGLELVARTDLDLRVGRDARARWLPASLPQLHLRGGVDATMAAAAKPAQPLTVGLRGLQLSDRRGDDGAPLMAAPATFLQLDGAIDLAASTLDLRGGGSLPALGPTLRAFDVKGLDGGLSLSELVVRGPLRSPEISVQLRGRALQGYGVTLDSVRTELVLGGGVLELRQLDARLAQGRVTGALALDLYDGDLSRLRSPMLLRGKGVGVQGVELAPLLGGMGVRGVAGRARVDRLQFHMALDAPLQSFRGGGHVHVEALQAADERFERADADVRFGGGKVEVQGLALIVPPLLRRGEPPLGVRGQISGALSVGLADGRWAVDLSIPTLHFQQFGSVRKLQLPLFGRLDGRVAAEGDRRDLRIDGERTAIQLRELAWDAIAMGDAQVRLAKARGQPAIVTSDAFFPRFALLEGSAIHFRGLLPEVVALQLDASRFDPWVLLALPPMEGVTVFVAGRAEFRLDFRPGQPVFSVDAHLQPAGLEVELQNGMDPIRNRLPATVRVLPDRVEFDSTELVISGNPVELCGAFLYPVAATGEPSRLRLYLAGSLDVPRFGALAESMASLELGFDIGQDPEVAADPGASCLQGRLSRIGKMRVIGPLDALQPRGQVVLRPSRLTPRGYGKEIALMGGARLLLGVDDRGRLRVEIPDKAPLEGVVDDGRFRLHGVAALDGYRAEEVDLRVSGVDLAYVAPKEYGLVFSPTLRFRGDHLGDSSARKMQLSGDVVITEGQYSKSFDALGKVIGGVRGREIDAYSAPLLERMPWLGEIGFDIAVRGQNFEVLSRFPFGRTDLELGIDMRIRGAWANPAIFGRVEVLPGSLLTYSVVRREFEVTEGAIDFNGSVDRAWLTLSARTEITLDAGSTQSTSVTSSVGPTLGSSGTAQTNKVVVMIAISGPLDDPRRLDIQLSSTPSYAPEDIQSLVLTGQLNTSGGSGGAIGSRSSINLLTEDLAEAFSKMLLSAFVDSVSIGIPTSGGINAKVTTSLGKAILLTGAVYQDSTGARDSSATVSIRLGEHWSLDGLLRSQLSNTSGSTGQAVNVYEAKLRYRIPLSE